MILFFEMQVPMYEVGSSSTARDISSDLVFCRGPGEDQWQILNKI